MKELNLNPEFSFEIVIGLPYAYWLHQRGELKSVTTSKGMTPFYYFCDDVREVHTNRSVNNQINGIQTMPNDWIHHNAMSLCGRDYSTLSESEKIEINGVLDYSEWTPPPLKTYYANDQFKLDRPFVVVSNRYNIEHGKPPRGYFSIECLYNIFDILTEAGYAVVYKCPRNTEFPIDENESMTLNQGYQLQANVEGIGVINDYELVNRFDNVHLLDDIVKEHGLDYNESQLKLFANAEGFVSMAGGNGAFCSYFGTTNITYVTTSGELRPGYFSENSWYKKLSGANVIPVIDPEKEITKRGYHDYDKLYKMIKQEFKGVN